MRIKELPLLIIISLALTLASCYVETQPFLDKTSKQFYELTQIIMTETEKREFLSIPYPEIQHAWIAQFWRERDPDPSTSKNEALEAYYRRVFYANATFSEPGLKGVDTIRGRILILVGIPDRIISVRSIEELQLELSLLFTWQRQHVDLPSHIEEGQIWIYTTERLVLVFVKESFSARWKWINLDPHILSVIEKRNRLAHKIKPLKGKLNYPFFTIKVPKEDLTWTKNGAKFYVIIHRGWPFVKAQKQIFLIRVPKIQDVTLKFRLNLKKKPEWIFVLVVDTLTRNFRCILLK